MRVSCIRVISSESMVAEYLLKLVKKQWLNFLLGSYDSETRVHVITNYSMAVEL